MKTNNFYQLCYGNPSEVYTVKLDVLGSVLKANTCIVKVMTEMFFKRVNCFVIYDFEGAPLLAQKSWRKFPGVSVTKIGHFTKFSFK